MDSDEEYLESVSRKVNINGVDVPAFSPIVRLHRAVELEKEERQDLFEKAKDAADIRYNIRQNVINEQLQGIRTGRLAALSAFGISLGIEYGIDYVQELFKPKDEILKEKQIIKIIKTSKLKDYEIVSTKYDDIINRLREVDSNVNKMTGNEDVKSQLLLDEIRFSVIASHLKKIQKESDSNLAVQYLKYFKIGSWCGLGTDIPQALMREKLEKPFQTNRIDGICKMHDLAYLNAKSKEDIAKADRDMLMNIIDTYTISGLSKVELNVLKEWTLQSAKDTLLSFFTNLNVPKTIGQLFAVKEFFKPTRAGETMSVKKGFAAYALLRDKLVAITGFTAILLKTIGEYFYGDTMIKFNPETEFDENDIMEAINEFEQYESQRLVDAGYEIQVEEEKEDELYEKKEENKIELIENKGIEKEENEDELYEKNALENEVEEENEDELYEKNALENEIEE
jgi:hypothetical protein